jgi:hypothetical protein
VIRLYCSDYRIELVEWKNERFRFLLHLSLSTNVIFGLSNPNDTVLEHGKVIDRVHAVDHELFGGQWMPRPERAARVLLKCKRQFVIQLCMSVLTSSS